MPAGLFSTTMSTRPAQFLSRLSRPLRKPEFARADTPSVNGIWLSSVRQKGNQLGVTTETRDSLRAAVMAANPPNDVGELLLKLGSARTARCYLGNCAGVYTDARPSWTNAKIH